VAPRPSLRGVTDVVAQMRAQRWADTPELPDRVLRSIASKTLNTRLSIRANYRVWKAWCATQKPAAKPYPAKPEAVAQFLQDNGPPIRVSRRGDFELVTDATATPAGTPIKTYATLSRYLATLSKLHADGGHADPTRDAEVVAVWRVLRRGLPRPIQKAALSLDVIDAAVAQLPNTPIGKRDRALILLAYALMARRSELVALDVENFTFDGDGSAIVSFERTKTGELSTSFLPPSVTTIVTEWLLASRINEGPVFVRRDFGVGDRRTRMSAQSVALVFKRIARRLNLPDLDASRISSHSARIGATHDLVEDGHSDAAIMRDAGWRTPRMVGMYSRGAKAKQGAMASRLARPAGIEPG
jgi:integrase